MYSTEELLLIWADSFGGLEYKHKKTVSERLSVNGNVKEDLLSLKDTLGAEIGEECFNSILASAENDYLRSIIGELSKKGIKAVTLKSDGYPERLAETEFAPLVLYCMGDESLLREETFSVVGSRKSLPVSLAIARDFTAELKKSGFIPVTGTAEGVDEAVLRSALETDGKVISVVAGGFDHIYPSSNAELIKQVAKTGLVISEHREHVKPMPYFFPVRNRIIAGISQGTLIVNGRIKSGTMHTAEYCIEYGRDLFAIPYTPGTESGAGTNELIRRGATLTETPSDILSYYGKKTESPAPVTLTEEEKRITEVLKQGCLHIEKIAEKTGKTVFELSPVLTVLEMNGIIYKDGINTFGLLRTAEE